MNENNFSAHNLRFLLGEQQQRFAALDVGQPREILPRCAAALRSPTILMISGLRRVGKSTLQAQMARQFFPDNYYYINFDDERWTGFQAQQFNAVLQELIGLFGDKKYFLLDEVQNVPRWELFVRRLHDAGYKVILTGSNALLLSREIGTRLTGRHRTLELFPFSFREYLQFIGLAPVMKTTADAARLGKAFRAYLSAGGIPDALKYPEDNFCAQLYQDIIYRDISARYNIDSLASVKELALFLAGNVGRPISFNKLRQHLMMGSVNTIKTYVDHLQASWLYSTVHVYSRSLKQQQIAPKKVYCIDNGIVQQVAFRSSDDTGWFLENAVFLQLRRHTADIFYVKNDDGSEVDFLMRQGTKPAQLIQVAAAIDHAATRARELSALSQAMEHYALTKGTIVTLDHEEIVRDGRRRIHIVPAARWFTEPVLRS